MGSIAAQFRLCLLIVVAGAVVLATAAEVLAVVLVPVLVLVVALAEQ